MLCHFRVMLVGILAIAAISLLSAPARADIVTFRFDGVYWFGSAPGLPAFTNTDEIYGTYSFDSLSLGFTAPPTFAIYFNAPITLTGAVTGANNSFNFGAKNGYTFIFDNSGSNPPFLDLYGVNDSVLPSGGLSSYTFSGFSLDMFEYGSNPSLIQGLALPLVPPDMTLGFNYIVVSLTPATGGDASPIYFWLTDLKAVPEPASLLLLGTGLGGLALAVRRRKK